jgi:hypothetical protein
MEADESAREFTAKLTLVPKSAVSKKKHLIEIS